ncbi:hypothetical protein A9R01_14810 ['Osedax' symbiont bacterium Rs2_46_30_T18]|nr:hypothetical protein A9R01_14810 ['Osedax' symbiont bacterium Rs2_46_30_T18]
MRRTTDKYHLLRIFCQVVDKQSFTEAAKYLQVPSSSVSKAVSQLEAELDQTLLYRTTRSMALTDAGNIYYKQGRRLLSDWQALDNQIKELTGAPKGLLRITTPVVLGQNLLSKIALDFMLAHPQIELDIILSNKVMDLIEDDIDVAFRTWTKLSDSALYKTDMLQMRLVMVASPGYLQEWGTPSKIEDLKNHQLIMFKSGTDMRNHWGFIDSQIKLRGKMYSNNTFVLMEAALRGVGIANIYSHFADSLIASGQLVEVLSDEIQSTSTVSALYRQHRRTSAKLDCFLTFVQQALKAGNV